MPRVKLENSAGHPGMLTKREADEILYRSEEEQEELDSLEPSTCHIIDMKSVKLVDDAIESEAIDPEDEEAAA